MLVLSVWSYMSHLPGWALFSRFGKFSAIFCWICFLCLGLIPSPSMPLTHRLGLLMESQSSCYVPFIFLHCFPMYLSFLFVISTCLQVMNFYFLLVPVSWRGFQLIFFYLSKGVFYLFIYFGSTWVWLRPSCLVGTYSTSSFLVGCLSR
jgi:hypothetical protein